MLQNFKQLAHQLFLLLVTCNLDVFVAGQGKVVDGIQTLGRLPLPPPPTSPATSQRFFASNRNGRPVPSLTASQTVGPGGPLVFSDANYIGLIANFDRERIPERVVHAKGAGAFGYFELTKDISQYTKASLFNGSPGKKTPIAVRFSTVVGGLGSADTEHDMRGFAVKFYTDKGNLDILAVNFEVFPIKDPTLFASLMHSRKKNPVTKNADPNTFWDFVSHRPETTNSNIRIFSHMGFPDGNRHMTGAAVSAFKLVNAAGDHMFAKFHFVTDQGFKSLTRQEYSILRGTNPDYFIQDLYNAILRKDYPSWTVSIQLMSPVTANKNPYNPFDPTKMWLHEDHPLIPIGKLVLNENPKDFFTDVEQVAFDLANLVPGIELSPDPLLQARTFPYLDTQRYRLGGNFEQLQVNRPKSVHQPLSTYERDGACMISSADNGAGVTNYYPNSFGGPKIDPTAGDLPFNISGVVDRYDGNGPLNLDDNFSQAKLFLKTLTPAQREILVGNLAASLGGVILRIRVKALALFKEVDVALVVEIESAIAQMEADAAKPSPAPAPGRAPAPGPAPAPGSAPAPAPGSAPAPRSVPVPAPAPVPSTLAYRKVGW